MPYLNFEGFGFVDISSKPMAAWNVVRGGFCSTARLPAHEQLGAISFAMADMILSSVGQGRQSARFESELLIEQIRRQEFPNAVSRLNGLFVFDDPGCALRAADSSVWGRHFETGNLTDFGVSAVNMSRHDAKWIERIRDINNRHGPDWEELARRYWRGDPVDNDPLWEVIVDGFMTLWGKDLKEKAVIEINEFWPESLPLLEYAANAAYLGSFDGATVPYMSSKDGRGRLSYYLRMIDAKDGKFVKKVYDFRKTSEKAARFHVSSDREVELKPPDFSIYSKEFDVISVEFLEG